MKLGLKGLGLFKNNTGSGGGAAPSGMALGMNLGTGWTYSGALPFNNMSLSGRYWELMSGTATWTQDQGILTVSSVTGTAVFQLLVVDNSLGYTPASGNFTLVNPNGHNVGVGTYGNQTYLAHSTTTSNRTAAYVSGNFLSISMSITAPGTYGSGVALIMPGQLTAWQGGDNFSSDFVSYYAGLSSPVLRTMDWTSTNSNIDTDWTDRTVTTKPCYANSLYTGSQVPWETVIAMANKLNKDVWVNVPIRATQSYVNSMAALFAANLNSNLKVYLETANEIWNTAGPFAAAYNWTQFLTFTKVSATVNAGTGIVTKTAHGLSNGKILNGFVTRASRQAGVLDNDASGNQNYFVACWGRNAYVTVIDANTFRVYEDVARTTQITFPTGVTDWIYIVADEAGKTADLDGNYVSLVARNVAAFDSAMGSSRVKAIVGSQAANTGYTTARLAALGASRADYVAIAPYFYPLWLGGAVNRTSNTFTPKAWTNAGSTNREGESCTVHFAVYANGSTPSTADIKAGTGTGYVGRVTPWTANNTNATYTTAGGGVTVSNGTTYTCFMLFVDGDGYTHKIQQNIAAANVTDTIDVLDSYANQAMRCYESMDHATTGSFKRIADHLTAIAGSAKPAVQLVDYEGGMHLDESAPTAIAAWMVAFTESSTFGTVLKHYVNGVSARDVQAHCIFSDVSINSLSWATADSYTDTSDERYLAMASYAGRVPVLTEVDSGTITGTDQPTAPSYPATIATLIGSSLTYTILKGDDAGNFSVSSGSLLMNSGTGINFGVNAAQTITIHATDGYTDAVFNVTFTTGPAIYYGTNDLYAWNAVADVNATQINPDKGSALTISAGAGASISGGYWDDGGSTVYENSNGLTVAVNTTTGDFVIAVTVAKGALGSNSTQCGPRIGVLPFIYPIMKTANTLAWYIHNGTDEVDISVATLDATPRVYWLQYKSGDAKIRYGHNQTYDNASGSSGDTCPITFPTSFDRYTALTENCRQYGSFRVLNESGTNVLAVAQSLQTLHGL